MPPPHSTHITQAWLVMLTEGGLWTAEELAQRVGAPCAKLSSGLSQLHRHRAVVQHPPAEGEIGLRYGVTGTCRVLQGLRVGEVQV